MTGMADEGYIDDDEVANGSGNSVTTTSPHAIGFDQLPLQDREELVYKLLASLPRAQIARVHRRIAPCVQVDIVGALPSELALHILSYVPWQVLLKCSLVSRRWRALADDNSLWQGLCEQRGWAWRWPSVPHSPSPIFRDREEEFDDEGMGDDEDSESDGHGSHTQIVVYEPPSQPHGFIGLPPTPRIGQHRRAGSPKQPRRSSPAPSPAFSAKSQTKFRPFYYRHSAPSVLPSAESPKPNYKLLHQTRVLLSNRLLHGAFRFSTLQTRGTPNAHTSIIYCLQLYTYEDSGRQVLFTGSKDRTVCEWNLTTGTVERVFEGVHTGSVLSLCAHGSFLASAGSDWRVCVWDLRDGTLVHTIMDHQESVLCVRFDAKRLVSCSKDRTVRMYRFTENQNNTKISTPGQPVLGEGTILGMHRVAVNAVALSGALVVSASGDKSLRLWDADTGALLRTIEGHHTRGIAAIDIAPPLVLSGSSDKHIRLFDIERRRGWSTFPDFHDPLVRRTAQGVVCKTCGGVLGGESGDQGGGGGGSQSRRASVAASDAHTDLVRSVAIGSDFVLSGSYDQSIKVWDRETGSLVADLSGRHDGRVFCVGFDCTKIVSCGEDQKICIWDLSHGIDTSFIKL